MWAFQFFCLILYGVSKALRAMNSTTNSTPIDEQTSLHPTRNEVSELYLSGCKSLMNSNLLGFTIFIKDMQVFIRQMRWNRHALACYFVLFLSNTQQCLASAWRTVRSPNTWLPPLTHVSSPSLPPLSSLLILVLILILKEKQQPWASGMLCALLATRTPRRPLLTRGSPLSWWWWWPSSVPVLPRGRTEVTGVPLLALPLSGRWATFYFIFYLAPSSLPSTHVLRWPALSLIFSRGVHTSKYIYNTYLYIFMPDTILLLSFTLRPWRWLLVSSVYGHFSAYTVQLYL